MGITILSNGKGHLGPTDRNDHIGQSGPPSKLVPNIAVRPCKPKLPEFWLEWKAPQEGGNDYNFDAIPSFRYPSVPKVQRNCISGH